MRRRISLLIVVLFIFIGCRSSTSTSQLEASNLIDSIRINTAGGLIESLPIAHHGLTVVNLFDEFCSECPTGSRFQTVTHLSESPRPPGKILLVLSDEHFSSDTTWRISERYSRTMPWLKVTLQLRSPIWITESCWLCSIQIAGSFGMRNLAWVKLKFLLLFLTCFSFAVY